MMTIRRSEPLLDHGAPSCLQEPFAFSTQPAGPSSGEKLPAGSPKEPQTGSLFRCEILEMIGVWKSGSSLCNVHQRRQVLWQFGELGCPWASSLLGPNYDGQLLNTLDDILKLERDDWFPEVTDIPKSQYAVMFRRCNGSLSNSL